MLSVRVIPGKTGSENREKRQTSIADAAKKMGTQLKDPLAANGPEQTNRPQRIGRVNLCSFAQATPACQRCVCSDAAAAAASGEVAAAPAVAGAFATASPIKANEDNPH